MGTDSKEVKSGYQFGAFQGVFVPNILTILGVIMYLRFGWVLANAGLIKTIVIVVLSTTITLLTSFSISQLATNAKIGAGGAYYIVSRSLGPQAGAAIGLPLFFGQALSVAFYVVGFAESLRGYFPGTSVSLIAIVSLLVLMVIACISSSFALKIQFFILVGIVLSLVSFFLGDASNLETSATPAVFIAQPFWVVFAVFFPAVTGILSGLSMSGDLKSPAKALPLGTISAVLVSFVVYLAIPLYLNHLKITAETLMEFPFIMKHVARWSTPVLIGLWGASVSSALGSLLGAPRTLQALANDSIVFKFFGRGYGKNNEPYGALVLCSLIAVGGVLAGSLDLIASILTMFFLTTYGLLNFAAAMEGLIRNPSWRPSFKVHWAFPLAGAIGCLVVMLLINVVATIIATLISGGIYFLMHQRKMNAYWGDMKYAILMLLAKYALYRLVSVKVHEKSWRPNILVLSGSPTTRKHLIMLADAVSHGKGFLTVATILSGQTIDQERLESMKQSIETYLTGHHIPAIVRVQSGAGDVHENARHMIEYYGFGPLVPNTILMGVSEDRDNERSYTELLLTAYRKRKNIILIRETEETDEDVEARRSSIDIWWRRGGNNAALMLALGYLLTTNPEWPGGKLTLKTIVSGETDIETEGELLRSFLKKANVEASIEVISQGSDSPFECIRKSSKDADLVFLGLREPEEGETVDSYSGYYNTFISALADFPTAVLVMASEEVDFQKIFELHEKEY